MGVESWARPLTDDEAPAWVLGNCLLGLGGCWLWLGPVARRFNGPGGDRAMASGAPVKGPAARVLWQQLRGRLPSWIVVRHRCDNAMCVRPEHLQVGTHRMNSRDALVRGRLRPGGRPPAPTDSGQLALI